MKINKLNTSSEKEKLFSIMESINDNEIKDKVRKEDEYNLFEE